MFFVLAPSKLPSILDTVRFALLMIALAACEPAYGESSDPAKPMTETKPAPKSAKVRIEWSNVRVTDGCFFFSGPDGRDDKLVGTATVTRDKTEVKIDFATATFRGVTRETVTVATRVSEHDFGGPWTVNEVIRGRFLEGGFTGQYRYSECEQSAKRCPGPCVIEADIALRP